MSNILLKLYHALPAPCQSIAASLHGYCLHRQRYGPHTEQLVEEALERDHWGKEQWQNWQDERLRYILHRAATRVPFYRNYWSGRKRDGAQHAWEDLKNWPILYKESVRANPATFLADDCDSRTMDSRHTSGTTGTPLDVWLSRNTVRSLYAIRDTRTCRWLGVHVKDRWGHVGGQPVVPRNRKHPPFWVWNAGLKQLYLSSMHIAPWSAQAYLAAIRDYRLKYLLGYASSIYLLAVEAQAIGASLPLQAVTTDSEPLFDHQRSAISIGFQCHVQQVYGPAEAVCAASECMAKRLHLWPELGIVEIVDERGQGVAPGIPGRIVATSLLNADMPLIRYDTRDRGELAPESTVCKCGRSLPVLERVWGRWDDVIITNDGRQIVQIDRVFDSSMGIREAQIIQEAIGRFCVKVVPGREWSETNEGRLVSSLHELVGEAQITVEPTAHIERTWAGKFRVIVSKLSASQMPQGSDGAAE